MIAAYELGVADRLKIVRVIADSANPNPAVVEHNPLGRIPTLVLDDGTVLQDSAVIVDFLTATFGGSLIPPAGPERWSALSLQSLADGVMEADIRWMEERRRPPEERRQGIVKGMRAKIEASLDRIEHDPPVQLTVGAIAVASALAHLDFRFSDVPWRPGRPRLDSWFTEFSRRPSMAATTFVDQY
jgi:glutathione S-transferase